MAQHLKHSPIRQRVDPPKPIPTPWLWNQASEYDGIVWARENGTELSLVTPYLQQLNLIYQTDKYLVALFIAPVWLNPDIIGTGLPLKKLGDNRYQSYPNDQNLLEDNAVHLVDGGTFVSLDFKHMQYVDPATFWTLDAISVKPDQKLPLLATSTNAETAPPSGAIRTNTLLQALAEQGHPMAEIEGRLENTSTPSQLPLVVKHLMRKLTHVVVVSVRILILLTCLAFLWSLITMATFSASDSQSIIFFALIAVLIWLIVSNRKFVGGNRLVGRGAGNSGESSDEPAGGTGSTSQAGGSWFDGLKGWLLWKTFAGDQLRRKFEERIEMVSKLIREDKIDQALKYALSLGNDDKKKGRLRDLPSNLPEARRHLDLDFAGSERGRSSILTQPGYYDLAQQYRELAANLQNTGDYKRAAFVFSELLSDQNAAVDALEAGSLFEDAARLAMAHKLDATNIVRLWYLAGNLDMALTMARRFDLLGLLASMSYKSHPEFEKFVRTQWAWQLAHTGNLVQAIEVSDGLEALCEQQKVWLLEAIRQYGLKNDALLCRATLNIAWSVSVLDKKPETFANDATGLVEQSLLQLLQGETKLDQSRRQALIGNLLNARTNKTPCHGEFWSRRAGVLCNQLIRTRLHKDGLEMANGEVAVLKRLAKEAGLRVLSEDLRQIVRKTPPCPDPNPIVQLTFAPAASTYWKHICLLANEWILLGSQSGQVKMISASGKVIWQDLLTDVSGFVPIGEGHRVLIIKGARNEKKSVVCLNIATRTYIECGVIELLRFKRSASPTSWLIQTSKAIVGLDVMAMLDEQNPRLESLWSITQTMPIAVNDFFETKNGNIGWYCQHALKTGWGPIEVWQAQKTKLDFETHLLEFTTDGDRNPYQEPIFSHGKGRFAYFDQSTKGLPEIEITTRPYSYDTEKAILRNITEQFGNLERPTRIKAFPDNGILFSRLLPGSDSGSKLLIKNDHHKQSFTIELENNQVVSYSTDNDGARAVVADDAGRLVICDFVKMEASTLTIV